MPQNNVTYTYGTSSNTGTNACGRLLRVDDGTGYQTFAYDRLGNVAENIRAIALPFEDSVYNFRMLFEYDTWNRVQRIVYPDSEVVTYNYDLAGNLNRVHTYKANHRDTLIKNILYDEFGHRTQVNFGNGVTTNYSYDILQRLNTLQTYSNNASLQKISYSFDLEDNITRVENTASGANGLGGAYVNTYNYDDLYRLTAANGTYSGNNTNYSLEMAYTPAGRLCSKLQDFTGTGNVYAYSPNNKQHAVRRIYNGLTNELYGLLWDANGNLAQQTVYSVNNNTTNYQTMRMLFWDEDDRLNLVAGDGYLSYYAYGYDGNRAIKMTGNAAIDQTGTLLNSTNLEIITIYPNEYLTVTQAEYTKYYYAGGNRIASKIGTGGFGKMQRLCTLDQSLTYNANTLLNFVLYQITNPTNQANDEYPVDVCGGYSVATELLTNPLHTLYITQANLNFTQNNLLQQFRQNLAGGTEPVYYFHSDHLGSASWITSGTGLPVQHLLYLPFGEHFVNEQSSGYFERFTFTGKERDAETGYYYHGARFNSSDIGWLSVDPMADKYPSLTPYNYCAWNPVKFIDLTGRNFDEPQRRAAIARAIEYEKANRVDPSQKSGRGNSKNTYSNGAKGKPGEKVDCSGLTSECIKAGGEVDPVGKYSGSGVQQTVKGSEKLSNIEFAEEGNLIVFNNQTHIGIIIEINYDQDGIISSFIIIHSSGRPERGFSGPHYETIPAKGTKDWKIDGIYKWDTRPDISVQLKDVIVKGTKIEE